MFSRVEIKKENRQRRFLFYSQKQKCTRNLICGWNHLATRQKQLAVFSGHGLIRPNTHRTFCGSGGYDLCRAAGYVASQLDAVRKRSEGGRSSHTRMHSFTHNPRRTQHGARTTQSPPRRAMHTRRTHDRTHVHTHALHDWQDCEQRHAAARREYYTPSSQSCKGKRQQELCFSFQSTRRGPKIASLHSLHRSFRVQ